MKISAKPASGMRDFRAEAVMRREYAIERIVAAYRAHGFEPLETPAVERLDVLGGKYGDEGDQLMFRILKRGRKLTDANADDPSTLSDLGLRYDLTVPLARVYAGHRNDLPRFYRRYQIQPVWRADRPQRGRFREFYQCDVDFIGSTSHIAEVEVLSAMGAALGALGFDDVVLRINDRRILGAMLTQAQVLEADHGPVLTVLDKIDKIGHEATRDGLREIGVSDEAMAALCELIPRLAGRDEAASLEALATRLAENEPGSEGAASLLRIIRCLGELLPAGISAVFDPTLVRGLSYYTGTIFEASVADLAGSVAGGGRYDGLIGMFSGTDVPAVGGSLGLERLLVVMEERGMFPELSRAGDVMVAPLDSDAIEYALRYAADLRRQGLTVQVYPGTTKLSKQLKYAESLGIRWVAIAGSREAESGRAQLKDLVSGEQTAADPEQAAGVVRGAK